MQALVKYARGAGHMEVREVPSPAPGPGEVRIRVAAAGVCGSDLHIHDDEIAIPIRVPVVVGHEFSGVVAEAGAGVDPTWVGRRVTAMPSVRVCGQCRYCRQGDLNLCPQRESMGYWHDGAFAPECVVPERCLWRLPDGVDDRAAALAEPLACAVHAVCEITDVRPGEVVAIIGPGNIGLLCLQVAVAVGARVVALGLPRDAHRLERARQLGAALALQTDPPEVPARAVADLTEGYGADVVLECSGSAAGANLGLELIRKQGRYTQVGLFGEAPRVALDRLVAREVIARGTFGQRPSSWRRALELMAGGAVDLGALVSDVLPLAQWQVGFDLCRTGAGFKVVFDLASG